MEVVMVPGDEDQSPPGAPIPVASDPQLQSQQQQQQSPHFAPYAKHDSNGVSRVGGLRGSGGCGVGGYEGAAERRMVDITRDKPIKVAVRVQVPVRDHPKFNFVGKLLGPKGNSLKRLQEDTMCKMAVLGRGSMKDRQKEEELRVSGDPKFSHLMEDLHVEISAYATPAEAHARIAYALAEVRRFLVPDYNDDIRQEQMWEMQILNTQGRDVGQAQGVEAPLSPASSVEAANSPTPATTANSINGQEDAMRPTPSPPHPQAVPAKTAVMTPVTSTLGGRKRPLLPNARPAMSPTKRTVMSLLARARAAQNKDPAVVAQQQPQQQPQPIPTSTSSSSPSTIPLQQVQQVQQQQQQAAVTAATSPMIQAALMPQGQAAPSPQVATSQTTVAPLQQLAHQRQPLIQSPHAQHPVLAPAIHGLLHAQRAAAGAATVLPILRDDFMPGVSQHHQVQNVHIA